MNVRSPLRRLALVPEPYSGESLLSWVDALARLNQVSRLMALRMTGMANGSSVSDAFGHHVSDAVVRSVWLTTGLTEEQVRGITLARYAGGALDPLPQPDAEGQDALAGWRYWQRMVLRQRSNACPVCLRENGARWLLKWRLVWSFACVEHRLYLISECRGCDAGLHPPRPGTPQSWICPGPAPGWGRSKPSRPCGRDIRRMPAKPVHDLRLLDCQQRIDRLLEGSEDLTQAQIHELFGALYRSMQDAWDAERPVRLPHTDKVVHQAWDSDHAPDGFRWQPRPFDRGRRPESRNRGRARLDGQRGGRTGEGPAELGPSPAKTPATPWRIPTAGEPLRRILPPPWLRDLGSGGARRDSERRVRRRHALSTARGSVHRPGTFAGTLRADHEHRPTTTIPRRPAP